MRTIHNCIKAKRFSDLSHNEQAIVENLMDSEEFEYLRSKLPIFSELSSFAWYKDGTSLIPSSIIFFLLGCHYANIPNYRFNELLKEQIEE